MRDEETCDAAYRSVAPKVTRVTAPLDLSAPRLVLASASPRRLMLLRQIGLEPHGIVSTEIDERPRPQELPGDYASRLAREKAEAARSSGVVKGVPPPFCILAADTVVAVGRRILPKAQTERDVRSCLALMSGRRHRVITALCVATDQGDVRLRGVVSAVRFKRLSKWEIDRYCDGGEGLGKAGGYAIQGMAAAFVPWLSGSYSNIVGLPLYETAQLLGSFGLRPGPARS